MAVKKEKRKEEEEGIRCLHLIVDILKQKARELNRIS